MPGRLRERIHMGLRHDPLVNHTAMKTTKYNPSPLEVDFANALFILQKEIQKHLEGNKITEVDNQIDKANPVVRFNLVDKDGDPHEIVVRIIQIPDKF